MFEAVLLISENAIIELLLITCLAGLIFCIFHCLHIHSCLAAWWHWNK